VRSLKTDFGRYNAPEVEFQDTNKIEREALHKCDIWAYGLCVWELFADGARYFDSSWANHPAYASQVSLDPPKYDSSQPNSPASASSSTEYIQSDASYDLSSRDELCTPASDPGKHSGLGTFDSKHLRRLSPKFAQTLRFPGFTIEKGYLIKLFENTLQVDASLRPSQITLLPTMTDWEYVNVTLRILPCSDFIFYLAVRIKEYCKGSSRCI
jgi:hypothetical protein